MRFLIEREPMELTTITGKFVIEIDHMQADKPITGTIKPL